MKKRYKVIFFLSIFLGMLFILSRTNNIKAATYGHYTYEENNDGTITIKKYDGTAANNIEIPSTLDGKTVTEIGYGAFAGCSGLTGELVIPDSVTKIGYAAFSDCSGLTGELVIPDSVTSIGGAAFRGCSGFTGNLVIPDGVTRIDGATFKDCRGFSGNLVIPNSVTSIGREDFYNCSGLIGDLVIPDSVTSIGIDAFFNCSGFTGNLTIGNSVTSIGGSAFYNCSGLTGNLVIPDSVTSIGGTAFWCCSGLTGDLVIPDSVTTIGDYTFCGCRGLTGKLVIPDSVTTIEENAFAGCSGLTGDLVIPDSVIIIGESAFQGCSGFTGSLTIGNSVTSVGESAFSGCSGLTNELVVPDSVTSIGESAFQGCSGFTGSLTLGNSVTSIGDYCFRGCKSLNNFVISENNASFCTIDGILYDKNITTLIQCLSGKTGNITIANTVTCIGKYAFYDCSKLTGSLVIPDSVTTIEENAFEGCSGFTGDLVIPDSITSIGGAAFRGCSGFTGNLVIPDSVTSICGSTFQECSGFTGNLVIPDSVTTIGGYAFFRCRGFTGNLTIGNSVTNIGESAFYNCSGFTGDLVIPDSVTSIGYRAFCGCSGFTGNLIIGNSVTDLGCEAFAGCYRLTGSIVIPESVTSIEREAFSPNYSGGRIGIDKFVFVADAPTIHISTYYYHPDYIYPFPNDEVKLYYRKGTTGYTAENNWPTNQLVQYTEALKKTNYTINNIVSGSSRPKIELDSTLSPLVTATYDVADRNVATVSKSGNVGYITPVNNGTTQVTVNLKYSDSVVRKLYATVTVDLKATNISLDKKQYTFSNGLAGQTLNLNATVLPEKTNNKTVRWTSSNTNVATVDDTGKVTTVASGECNITATTTDGSNLSDTCRIVVPKTVNSITLDTTSYLIRDNYEPITITATVLPSDAIDKRLNWTSSDQSVAYVEVIENTATLKAKLYQGTKSGRCTITAEAVDGSGTEATCEVEVNIPPTELKLDKTEFSFLNIGDRLKLNATITPSNAYQTVIWESSNTNIATVDENGNVTPVSNGECKITARSKENNNLSAECDITVNMPLKVTKITLNKTSHTFTSNTTLQLEATIEPSNAANKEITWESSNTNIATVDNTGKVTPKSNGECKITATANDGSGVKATCDITVNIPIKVTKITLNKTSHTFTSNTTLQLEATIEPSNATNKELTWESSNTNIATVDNTGKVTPKTNGVCKITATAKDGSGVKANCDVTVNIPIKVTKITLNKTSHTFTNNTTLQLEATVEPSNATNKELTWESSNTNIAIVDNTGKVTPKTNGECKITATAKDGSGVKATCDITVNIPVKVTKITLNKTSHTFTNNISLQLEATIEPSNATNKEITWESSNTNIATVDETGKVKPKSNGECRITATAKDGSGVKATCDVEVNMPQLIPVTNIYFTQDKVTITSPGFTPSYSPVIEPSNASNKNVTWTSSDASIATVDGTGVIRGVSNGTCNIIATTNDGTNLSASIEVTVSFPVKVTKITLNKTSHTFTKNVALQLEATIEPSNATNKEITWESSDPYIATVDENGKVRPKSNGACRITATAKDGSGVKATCDVEVNRPQLIPVTNIYFTQDKVTITSPGFTPSYNPVIEPSNASNKNVTWTSSDASIATVDGTGVIRGVSNGTCNIIATTNDGTNLSASIEVTVSFPVKVTKITLNKTSHTFTKNTSLQLEATIEPSNATNKEITWESSDPYIATVDETGKVKPKSNGECRITATAKDGSGVKATCDVEVNMPQMIPVTNIYFTQDKVTITSTGFTPTYSPVIEPSNASNQSVTWTSSDESIATVDRAGVIRGVSNGTCRITATTNDGTNLSASIEVTVSLPIKVTKLSINYPGSYVSFSKLNGTYTLKTIIEPENATNKELEWTSSDPSVATVDNTGKVTALKNGVCNITATTTDGSNLSATKEVRVEIQINVTEITLNKTSHTFTDSTPLQLTATVTPEEATNKEVTWKSSNTNIATVDKNGKVTPKANGECRITATATDESGVKATCDITVNVEGPLYKKGDINKDGKVSVMDVRYGLKALTKGTITAEEITIGDVNGDNKFSVIDARKILRYIVGKIPSLD